MERSKMLTRFLKAILAEASSLIAYHEARLQFVVFEKDKYMYDLSMERYKAETAQMNLFDFMED